MRIILYLVSLIGFGILAVQLFSLAAAGLAWIIIMLSAILVITIGFVCRGSLFAAVKATEVICDIADSANYADIQRERQHINEQLNDPYYFSRQQNEYQRKAEQYNKELKQLKNIYPFADVILFRQYAVYIANRQFDRLSVIRDNIIQSHRNNLNQFGRDN